MCNIIGVTLFGSESEWNLIDPALCGFEHTVQLIGSFRLLSTQAHMRILATICNALRVFLGQIEHVLLVFHHLLVRFLCLVHHLVYRNIVKVLLFTKDTILVVFQMIHQIQAFILVDEVLDAFDHASPKIIC